MVLSLTTLLLLCIPRYVFRFLSLYIVSLTTLLLLCIPRASQCCVLTVSWASKLQGVIAKSSTEAEFYGASFAGTEIKWLREFMQELGYSFPLPSPLFVDNQSAIQVLKDAVHHSRMKHIPIAEFWIRDEVSRVKSISVHYCPTASMPADLLTKPLSVAGVNTHRTAMGLS